MAPTNSTVASRPIPPEGLGDLLVAPRQGAAGLGLAAVGLGAVLMAAVIALNGPLLLVFAGVVLAIFGITNVGLAIFSPALSLYSGGIMTSRWGRDEYCLWSQVATLRVTDSDYFASGRRYENEIVIECLRNDGRKFTIAGITRQLAEAIEQTVYQHLLPQARATLASGGRVEFGALALTSDGVWRADELTRWLEIETCALEFNDTVVIKRRNRGSIRINFKRVGNLPLLVCLVNERLNVPPETK